MCNNEDFDIDEFDEDFLKDVNEKEELYYSQITSAIHDEVPSKRRRLDSPPEAPNQTEPVSTRKNLILDIFSSEKSQKSSQAPPKAPISSPRIPASLQRSPESIKNHQTLPETPKNPKTFSKNLGKSLALEVLSTIPKSSKNTPSIIPRPNPFKTPKRIHSTFSPGKRQVDLQKTLVRKFPGPAGLIPDNIDPSKSPETLNYLLVDENDTNVTNTSPEERKTEFCTQDTKNLFLHGAWNNMLNDLPKNFLDGYDIASLKDSNATKIPRLAVVIQQIDQASENPRVILRDISDSIEGIMHRDLAMNYPNILHSGVVLLLQDVGVLSFKVSSFCTTKVIVFSVNSVIAVYSEQGTLVKTPFLEAILNGNYEETKNRIKTKNSQPKEGKRVNVIKDKNIEESTSAASQEVHDEFGDFNFDEIDVNEFGDYKNDNNNDGVRIEEKLEEVRNDKNDSRNNAAEVSSGFGDDLLNDSDSDDEYLSQIDIDAISRINSFNN